MGLYLSQRFRRPYNEVKTKKSTSAKGSEFSSTLPNSGLYISMLLKVTTTIFIQVYNKQTIWSTSFHT